mmetsp:Transcript_41676/g.49938  ORF Transcript_41676/g.49938 Transcript_41676/m.49938 type:complete len:144 (+) Transcript_41676:3-434(+)
MNNINHNVFNNSFLLDYSELEEEDILTMATSSFGGERLSPNSYVLDMNQNFRSAYCRVGNRKGISKGQTTSQHSNTISHSAFALREGSNKQEARNIGGIITPSNVVHGHATANSFTKASAIRKRLEKYRSNGKRILAKRRNLS